MTSIMTSIMIDQHHYRLLADFGGYGNKLDLETCLWLLGYNAAGIQVFQGKDKSLVVVEVNVGQRN